jgi:hypothetical protein
VGHAYSALNLRLLLAGFGLVVCAVGAVVLFATGHPGFGGVVAVLGVVALVDLVVVQRRRALRRRGEPGRHRSLFE